MAIDIDIGVILLGIGLSVLGSILNFWQVVIQESHKSGVKGLMQMFENIKDDKSIKENLTELKDLDLKNRKKMIRSFVSVKRKAMRAKYLVKWTIAIFFGFVAGILYLLITEFEVNATFFAGALAAGYSGQSFVMSILKEEDLFEDVKPEELKQFVKMNELVSN